MTRMLLLGIAGIALVAGAVGAGTFAFFSSQATSNANTFAAGTLTLALSDSDETLLSTVSATWDKTNFAPGETVSGFLSLQNTGTVAANHVDVEAANVVTEAVSGPGTESTTLMDKVLQITFLCYNSNGDADCVDLGEVNLLTSLTDTNGNGIIDLDDLESQDVEGTEDIANMSLTDLATDHRLDMTVLFSSTLGVNQHQGDSVTTVFTIALNQDATQ